MNPPAAPPTARPFLWPGPAFDLNRRSVPAGELARWAGRHVAWAWDGSRVLAGADTLAELHDALVRSGIDPAAVVFDFVDPPDPAGG